MLQENILKEAPRLNTKEANERYTENSAKKTKNSPFSDA